MESEQGQNWFSWRLLMDYMAQRYSGSGSGMEGGMDLCDMEDWRGVTRPFRLHAMEDNWAGNALLSLCHGGRSVTTLGFPSSVNAEISGLVGSYDYPNTGSNHLHLPVLSEVSLMPLMKDSSCFLSILMRRCPAQPSEPVGSSNNGFVSSTYRVTVFQNGSLLITSVGPRNTGTYRCVGTGQRGRQLTLQAKLSLAKIEDMRPLSARILTAETLHRITCKQPDGLPPPTVWWTRSGQRIAEQGRVYQAGNELVFSPIMEEDTGVYTCHAANKAGEKQQDLEITVATSPEWVERPQDTAMDEGKSGFLHCLSKASPEPNVTWYRNGYLIVSDSRFQIFQNGTLKILNVEVYDGTIYTCVSRTPAGRIEASARVAVLENLKFTPPPQSQCLELDKEVTVHCSATGRTKPTIHWVKTDGSNLPPHVNSEAGLLRFHRVTRKDAGNYTCIASNSQQGEIKAMVYLSVAVFISFRIVPENTTVYQGNSAILHCQASADPVPHIQWRGRDGLIDGNKPHQRIQVMPNGSLVVYHVSSEDSGKYTCIAGNACNIVHRDSFLYVPPIITRGDLKQFLRISKSKDEKAKGLSTRHKVALCSQVALGMEHLSNNRFVHKDLAARNCLVSAQRVVKISALGLNKDVYNSEYYHLRQAWVPLRWMPPEAVQDDDFSTKSDIWSFGVLMWEVFSLGEMPFTPMADDEVLAGLQNGSLKLSAPENCSSRFYKLMQRCWAASPKERPSFSDIVNSLGDTSADSKV
ncbi:inactive tyrosine-protein kinase 7 [Pyxicephalus adspersus]|uniref:inactive tyrosine-protein kinase 7 n=1 Tax=Pyxicephalus adspersus TaxID=30357 RepID=UPI003B596BF5